MLTVASVWVRGNVAYSVEYVGRLAAMVRRHLSWPHRFVCLTDRPWEIPTDLEAIEIPPPTAAGWWSKLQLFNPAHGFDGRILYLDLDSLIVGPLDPIARWPSCFATIPDGGSAFQPKNGTAVIKRFNSSVMVFDGGVYPDLWESFDRTVVDQLWGDQDWLAMRHPEAKTLPAEWFPRLSAIGPGGEIPAEARVILAKKPKPLEAAKTWPWVAGIWRAA